MCKLGYTNLAEMLIQKSAKFNIDLNAKNDFGMTAFQSASNQKHEGIVEMMKKNAESFKIDLFLQKLTQ